MKHLSRLAVLATMLAIGGTALAADHSPHAPPPNFETTADGPPDGTTSVVQFDDVGEVGSSTVNMDDGALNDVNSAATKPSEVAYEEQHDDAMQQGNDVANSVSIACLRDDAAAYHADDGNTLEVGMSTGPPELAAAPFNTVTVGSTQTEVTWYVTVAVLEACDPSIIPPDWVAYAGPPDRANMTTIEMATQDEFQEVGTSTVGKVGTDVIVGGRAYDPGTAQARSSPRTNASDSASC